MQGIRKMNVVTSMLYLRGRRRALFRVDFFDIFIVLLMGMTVVVVVVATLRVVVAILRVVVVVVVALSEWQ